MEDGGGGELYFGSTLLGTVAGRLPASQEVGGELGLATTIDDVGDSETAVFTMSDSDGRVALWGCGVVGTSTLAVSSNCIGSSMATNSNQWRYGYAKGDDVAVHF